MHNQKPASLLQVKLSLRNHNNAEGLRQLLVIRRVLLILRLDNEHMGEFMAAPHFKQALKIMYLVSLYAKPHHQV